jgi:DNA-binding XRE family transcriptional regulator
MMTNTRPWSEIENRHRDDPEWEAGVATYRQMIDNSLKLAELRRARGKTQTEVAANIGISQKRVSKIENSGNPELETLRAYIKALGGNLEVRAVFPDRDPITFATG